MFARLTESTSEAGPGPAEPTLARSAPWCHVAEAWKPSVTRSLNSASLSGPTTGSAPAGPVARWNTLPSASALRHAQKRDVSGDWRRK